MNKYAYHLGISGMMGAVISSVNAISIAMGHAPTILYVADSLYIAGNSIHAVALSLSKSGINVETQTQPQTQTQIKNGP